jgi:propionate catabolism operon transcriptional regulator
MKNMLHETDDTPSASVAGKPGPRSRASLDEEPIAFIGPSRDALERAHQAAERLGIAITALAAAMEGAIAPGKRLQSQGVEAIVARRATATVLQEHLNIPVLSLQNTMTDILAALDRASRMCSRIVLCSFAKDEILDTAMLERLLGVRLEQALFSSRPSLEGIIRKARQDGCGVVVGGRYTASLARRMGVASVSIQASEEAVMAALEDARSVVRSRRIERERTLRYRAILDCAREGIVAVDAAGDLTSINQAARNFLRITGERDNCPPIRQLFAKSAVGVALKTARPVLNKLETIGREQFIMNHVPILAEDRVVGAVSTFLDISNVMLAESEIRRSLTKGLSAKYRLEDYLHQSPVIKALIGRIRRYACSDSTVLVNGETGTGKEIVAHGIHLASPRRRGPFVSINCSALPDQLLESELFGHEEGAFTGSRRGGKPGLFELAHQGTIFLDEAGGMPLGVQHRLLRVLQEKEVMRIGGDRVTPVDVRVVAASNRDLAEEVRLGRLREDLYFRLNVLSVRLPPLRERPEDVPLLVRRCLGRAFAKYEVKPFRIPPADMTRLRRLPWPGNVRQLEYVLERLALICQDGFDREVFEELYRELREYSEPAAGPVADSPPAIAQPAVMPAGQSEVERALIRAGYNKGRAARLLGVSRATFWRRLKRLGLERAAAVSE